MTSTCFNISSGEDLGARYYVRNDLSVNKNTAQNLGALGLGEDLYIALNFDAENEHDWLIYQTNP